MHFRTRRKLSYICFSGLVLCVVIIFLMTVCGKPDDFQQYTDVPIETKDYHFSTNLVVMVISAPDHRSVRNVIRETWASNVPRGVAVRFIIGSKSLTRAVLSDIQSENNTHSDVIFLDQVAESYNTLTKKLLETLKYADKFIRFNFLMKVDEDSFVRVDRILDELLSKPQERLYWGFFDGRGHVKKAGKWAEKEYFLCDRYLPYALGGGYVISKDIVSYVATSSDMLQLFNSEDVSLGTWLAPLNIHRIHDPNFDTEYKSRGCYNSYLVTHKKPPEELRQLQSNLDNLGKLCVTEKRIRLSYNYDWNEFPTKCCERKDPTVP